jgi:lipopolysaccharide transport system ATP-binding protein
MSDNAIVLSGVSKAYSSWGSSSERFWSLLTHRPATGELFWALRDVSLTVPRGSSLGLVGRNGAGKSTLLQIIAGTVEPTTGSVAVNGRVAPLLELGAGFNPDFTGWENVQFAAAIVGIPSSELRERARAIAEFADIGDFMSRPVKTYSSGMFARLAFAVAVHVDPDILLVDEILSVGDMGFQQRCLARLREMRERGVTLLFVSHGPDAIKSVCDHAIFLHQGQMVFAGTADETVDRYLAFIREEANKEQLALEKTWTKPEPLSTKLPGALRYGTGHVQFKRVEVRDEAGAPCRAFALGAQIVIEAEIESVIDIENLSLSFLVRDGTGIDILGTTTFDESVSLPPLKRHSSLTAQFAFRNPLRPGNYGVSLAINRVSRRDYTDNVLFDQADGALSFAVTENANRPVHYKIHQPVQIRFHTPSTSSPPPGPSSYELAAVQERRVSEA